MAANYVFDHTFPNIWHRLYYIETHGGDRTHSWMIYKQDGMYKAMSIHKYITLSGALAKEAKALKYDQSPSGYVIIEYNQLQPHLSEEELRKYVFDTGKVVVNTKKYLENHGI